MALNLAQKRYMRSGSSIKILIFDIFSLYTTNFIGPLSYQAFSFLKLLALS